MPFCPLEIKYSFKEFLQGESSLSLEKINLFDYQIRYLFRQEAKEQTRATKEGRKEGRKEKRGEGSRAYS